MKQLLQSLKDGTTEVVDVPAPNPSSGELLIRTQVSLVSAGTERMLVDFGKAGWLQKARQQPDKVKMVLDKVRTDGLAVTVESVRSKLDQPLALGYCNVGRIIGGSAAGFSLGDRVVSNGKHAEIVSVPKNLCAKIPSEVSDEAASFTVLAAIGLQGIRLAQPTLGECVIVTGLGLIGLLTVQMLLAQGCRVLGIDLDPERLRLARTFGAETVNVGSGQDVVAAAQVFSRGRGVDAVLVTASTKSSEPISHAARMCRKRGRIVLVGVSGLELSRADFYEKELSFQVSCSYGPGRYDRSYEEEGNDYPIGYVRWTEQRNFEAVLDLMARGAIDVKPLISHRFEVDDAPKVYELITSNEPSLGVLINYRREELISNKELAIRTVGVSPAKALNGRVSVGFVGAGNYALSVLIPAFRNAGAELANIVSNSGVSGVHAARKYGFVKTTTDVEELFHDSRVNAIVIATRHNSHAELVCRALRAGKHVFVEKPLALAHDELEAIIGARDEMIGLGFKPIIMVGFNRRFSPQIARASTLLRKNGGSHAFSITVNAGAIPADHWTQDPAIGGGRVVGEVCHFVDLARFLAGEDIVSSHVNVMKAGLGDTLTISLSFAGGSIGTINYYANGSKTFPKERVEVFSSGRILQLDNFRRMRGFGWRGFRTMNLWRQDKGQGACVDAFIQAVRFGRNEPIPFEELLEVSRVVIDCAEAARV